MAADVSPYDLKARLPWLRKCPVRIVSLSSLQGADDAESQLDFGI
jgi:hypothetical protein